jgi:hypothetical protein
LIVMKRSGTADLPLHGGHVPRWLSERMSRLGLAICESIIFQYGPDDLLKRFSDPFWFQSMGAVMGMDWHSSGITTSVLGALKPCINARSEELGLYICGGKGAHSRKTPSELLQIAEKTGLDAISLIRSSRLSAKVDNTAVQDGFQLYTHNFILGRNGHWTVVQQGMNPKNHTARRYHWHSGTLGSFVEEPHTAVCGANQGMILNLTAIAAKQTRQSILSLTGEPQVEMMNEIKKLVMPSRHEVLGEDIDLKRLGSILWLASERQPRQFEDLLLLEGLGPRTLQSLTLISEVIHGTPSRFSDPARYSMAHGGKDGHPFPVPLTVYDETIQVLDSAVRQAKIGSSEKQVAIQALHRIASTLESGFKPNERFPQWVEKERQDSWKHGGRTVSGYAGRPNHAIQLRLF